MKLNHCFVVVLSNRPVDYDRCSLNYLTRRFSRIDRLANVPEFLTLSSLYSGHLSYGSRLNVYNLTFANGRFIIELLVSFSSDRKIQHACFVEDRLLVCYEDSIEIWSNWLGNMQSEQVCSINDNWFAGLHTIFPLGTSRCVVSSSAADAAMIINLDTKSVVSRLRLPGYLYGFNYDLKESDSLKDHYIANDLQLGHLNCAFPDEEQNIWVSTLIQGDIGVFDCSGRYKKVISGYVGAHGVRRIKGRNQIYFSDSCLGVLIIADLHGQIVHRYFTVSKWMHDAQHIQDNLFLLGLSDLGRIVVADVVTGQEQQFPISGCDGYIQFFASMNPRFELSTTGAVLGDAKYVSFKRNDGVSAE